jgi:UDP-N-acetylglucosamine 4,6-dehydratase (inverting)
MLNHATVLVTGGTGSFGQEFVGTLLQRFPAITRLIVFSRDEQKQYEMSQKFSPTQYPCLRYMIGDVRDKNRLLEVLHGVDVVVHAAAIKHVHIAEYNPFECVKTNILGAQNLIEACIERGVKKVVALSTDKAANATGLYGATKLCADKLFIAGSLAEIESKPIFSVVRYGNVVGARGSVIPFFIEKKKEGVLPITNPAMTRFSITPKQGIDLVLFALERAMGGEVFVPKLPSYRLLDVAQAIAPACEYKIIGMRPGEKVHEEMIMTTDALNTIELEKHYVIIPPEPYYSQSNQIERYSQHHGGKPVAPDFEYNSGENTEWLSVEDLRQIIHEVLAYDVVVSE